VGDAGEAMLSFSNLPLLNAVLNGMSTLLLSGGYLAIRRRNIAVHKGFMLSACATSVLFLVSYVTYHYQVGSRSFLGQGGIRLVYFAVLISHTILAAVIAPLVLMTLYWALTARWPKHRRLARWTLPLWIYVSVTGVVIYLMLYQLYPVL
jgi:putative membrane protein